MPRSPPCRTKRASPPNAQIHNTLAQGFTSIITLLQAAESEWEHDGSAARKHLTLAADTARENLAEARAMVGALTPTPLESGSLTDAIARHAHAVGDRTTAEVTVVAGDIGDLPTAVEVVLLRSAQEALANIAKHAEASRITVELASTPHTVRLSVADDGNGFEPGSDTSGYGLAGMRTRAEQIGGTLTVDSGPGHGTEVTLEVPR
ncbi:sensor histidine kinase [Brevibacterium samyangense]|uniref:Oxygen sensor histidine kinase NreB n=1 Tax=Brevibacterium samyangense TaxID=366888 RepID=A0ABP5F0L0_9MICO